MRIRSIAFLITLTVILVTCTTLVGATGIQFTDITKKGTADGEVSASAALYQTVPIGVYADLDFYWYSAGKPAANKYVKLYQSKSGGSWTYVTGGYTNSKGYIGWKVKRSSPGTYRFRTKYGSVWSSTYTIHFGGCGVCPTPTISAYPRVGTRSTNFKFVGSARGTPSSWYWTFGDGKSAYGKAVYHKYTTTGYKTIKLTLKYPNGSSASIARCNYIRVR